VVDRSADFGLISQARRRKPKARSASVGQTGQGPIATSGIVNAWARR
jgi:hypothetical protein